MDVKCQPYQLIAGQRQNEILGEQFVEEKNNGVVSGKCRLFYLSRI